MKSIYLKFPRLEDKDKWIEYSLERNKGVMPPISYEEWLKQKMINIKNNTSINYFLMNNNRIIGTLQIRPTFKELDGNIGYGIRQSERNKGYGTKILSLALEECDVIGLDEVIITCKEDNIASSKVIEKNHGILREITYVEEEDSNYNIYSINVKKTLKRK